MCVLFEGMGGVRLLQGQVGDCCKSGRLTAFGKASGTSVVHTWPLKTARGSSATWMKYIQFVLHPLNPSFIEISKYVLPLH